MPHDIETYVRLRSLGSAQKEFGEIIKSQGSFIEDAANDLVGEKMDGEDEGGDMTEPEDEKKKKKKPLKLKVMKIKGM